MRASRRVPEPSAHYTAGVAAAETLLGILASSVAKHGALRQAMHELMLKGQPQLLAGFLDTLQSRLEVPDDESD